MFSDKFLLVLFCTGALLFTQHSAQGQVSVPSASELIGAAFELDFNDNGSVDVIFEIIDETTLTFIDRRGPEEVSSVENYDLPDDTPPGTITINIDSKPSYFFTFSTETEGTFTELAGPGSSSGSFTFIPAAEAPSGPPVTFSEWISVVFDSETPESDKLWDADPNADGVTNGMAYAFGLAPLENNRMQLPFLQIDSSNSKFHFRRNKNASDLTYVVQSSTDLQSWSNLTGDFTVVVTDADGDGNSEWVFLDLTNSVINEGSKFFRLLITK